MLKPRIIVILAPIVVLFIGLLLLQLIAPSGTQPNEPERSWLPSLGSSEPTTLTSQQQRQCANAPFLIPTEGYVGLYYNDPSRPYNLSRRHQGVDIFTDEPIGTQPVYAVYDGYITHRWDWPSAVIQRIPSDPLNPGTQIWVYYTHMADAAGNDYIEPAFDLGAVEVFVTKGTLLGYVGNYDGNQPSRIHPHLHLSIVKDDGRGSYLNELQIINTLDPSPYLGLAVGYASAEINNPNCRPASN